MTDKSPEQLAEQFKDDPDFENRKEAKCKVITLKDILIKIPKPKEYILSPWLPKSSICMVYAWRGRGKTLFALNVAMAAAHGLEFLGWKADKPSRVLYLDGEMDFEDLQSRLALFVKMYNLQEVSNDFHVVTPEEQESDMPNIGTKEGQKAIDEIIVKENIDFIVIDNFSTLANGIDENKSQDWDRVQKWMLYWKKRGKAILGVHHSGKNELQRGSSKKEDIMHTVISLKKPEGYSSTQGARFNVIFEKNRSFHGQDAAPFEAWLKEDSNGFSKWHISEIEADIETRVSGLLKKGLGSSHIARELNVSRQHVNYYKSKLEKKDE